LNALVLEDGQLWLVGFNNGFPVTQVHASTQASAGRLQAADVRYVDYRSGNFLRGSLQGSYAEGSSISATLSMNGTRTGPHILNPMPETTFDYNRAASLADVAGSWVAQGTQISVRSDGTFEALNGGCLNTGTLTPHASKNVFTLDMTTGAAPCQSPGQRLTGVVVSFTSAGKQTLLATALNDSNSLTLVGARP
jgi:hypothetical protein